jgi:hypothetical protein
MSEQELYEIASQRIDQRTRRWTLWAVNLAVLIFCLAGVVSNIVSVAIFLAWGGVFTFHTIVAGFAEARQGEIDSLVDKLRAAREMYEKPKRLELSEDGELVDTDEDEVRETRHQRLKS